MTRENAVKLCRKELDFYGLSDWHIRLSQLNNGLMGLCDCDNKTIILGTLHIDSHPDPEIHDTIKHEIAHALTPGHKHDLVWMAKAKLLGCNPVPCSSLAFNPEMIDAVRSGKQIEITFEEETVIRKVEVEEKVIKPKYNITQLSEKCPTCGKTAVTKSEQIVVMSGESDPDYKYIYLECGHIVIKRIPKGTPFHLIVSNSSKDSVKSCKHNWVKTTCTKCNEFKPYNFQLEGMKFLERALSTQKGGAIFDDMGLGKTIQALGTIKFHPENWPVLFIVKSSIKFQWFKEILRWMGDEFVGQIINSSNDILIPGLKVYIIAYDMMVYKERKSRSGKIIKQGFDISKFDGVIKTVVVDECQLLKNPDSSRTQQVRRIVKDKQIIALSATPWKNRGSEFFAILNMLDPVKFPSYAKFIEQWVDKYWDGNKLKEGGIRNPKKFQEYCKDIFLRREVEEVDAELPTTNRMRLDIQLDDLSQTTYDDETSNFVKWYNEFVISGTEEQINGLEILAKMARMRHITGLAKIEATETFAEQFYEETERKLVVFVHHKDVGSILYDSFVSKFGKDIDVFKLTGEQNDLERFQIQEAFQASKRAFMIASTLAAGEGINLQTCADAILHEKQWNPQNEDQAAPGRFRRIGSEHKHVNVTNVLAEGTIDDILYGMVERKRNQFHNAMNKGELMAWNESSLAHELAQIVVERFRAKNKGKPIKNVNDKTLSQLARM